MHRVVLTGIQALAIIAIGGLVGYALALASRFVSGIYPPW